MPFVFVDCLDMYCLFVCSAACIFTNMDLCFQIFLPCHLILYFSFPPPMQITFSLLFSLVIAFISDALSTVPDKSSVLSRDASFRKEFHEIVRLTIMEIFLAIRGNLSYLMIC